VNDARHGAVLIQALMIDKYGYYIGFYFIGVLDHAGDKKVNFEIYIADRKATTCI